MKTREERLEYMRQWYRDHREEQRAKQKAWNTAHQEEVAEYVREYRRRNPAAARERNRKWREQHPDYFKRYRQEHKEQKRESDNASREIRRARRHQVPTEYISIKMLRERDRNICQICKRVVGSRGASIDHIVPISHGGSHTWENVQLAHTKCNSSRGAGRLPAQMRLGGMASTRTPGPPTKRKLTEAIVRRIRYGGERAAALAAELGLGQRTVYDIRQSKTWAWLGVE